MPLYEYECEKCSELFDELRKAADRAEPIQCPKCGGDGHVVFSRFAQSSGGSRQSALAPCGSAPPPGGCDPGST